VFYIVLKSYLFWNPFQWRLFRSGKDAASDKINNCQQNKHTASTEIFESFYQGSIRSELINFFNLYMFKTF